MSLTTMTTGRLLAAMLLSASQHMPPVSAPSPTTATTCRCSPRSAVGLGQAVGVRQRRRGVAVLDQVVLGLGAARVARQAALLAQRLERLAAAAGDELVHVRLVAGVPQDLVARASRRPGAARASVSTTPRLGPRWPPVRETVSTMRSRISAASSGSCSGREALEVGGAVHAVEQAHGRLLVLGQGLESRAQARRARRAPRPATDLHTPLSQPGHVALAAQRGVDEPDLPAGRAPAAGPPARTPRCAASTASGGTTSRSSARAVRMPSRAASTADRDVPGGEPRQQHRVAAQHLVGAVVRRAQVVAARPTALRSQSGACGGSTSARASRAGRARGTGSLLRRSGLDGCCRCNQGDRAAGDAGRRGPAPARGRPGAARPAGRPAGPCTAGPPSSAAPPPPLPGDTHSPVDRTVLTARLRSVETSALLPGTTLALMVVPSPAVAADLAASCDQLVRGGATVVLLGPDLPRRVSDRSQPLTVPLRPTTPSPTSGACSPAARRGGSRSWPAARPTAPTAGAG